MGLNDEFQRRHATLRGERAQAPDNSSGRGPPHYAGDAAGRTDLWAVKERKARSARTDDKAGPSRSRIDGG
jgi:hypothetical protein